MKRPSRPSAGVSSASARAEVLAVLGVVGGHLKFGSVVTAKPGVLALVPPPPLKGLLTPLGAGVAIAGGLKTETMAQVCVASSDAGTVAVICVAVTLEVARVVCDPLAFQFTVEPPVGSEDGIKLL